MLICLERPHHSKAQERSRPAGFPKSASEEGGLDLWKASGVQRGHLVLTSLIIKTPSISRILSVESSVRAWTLTLTCQISLIHSSSYLMEVVTALQPFQQTFHPVVAIPERRILDRCRECEPGLSNPYLRDLTAIYGSLYIFPRKRNDGARSPAWEPFKGQFPAPVARQLLYRHDPRGLAPLVESSVRNT